MPLRLNPLWIQIRQISTCLRASPSVVENIHRGTSGQSSIMPVPDFYQIYDHQKRLERSYKESTEFREFNNSLLQASNDPQVKSIAIDYKNPKDLSSDVENQHLQAVLVATSLFCNVGFVPFFNKDNFPIFALVNKESTAQILGHKDSMLINPQNENLQLVPNLLLIKLKSESKAQTWVKEDVDILKELEEKYPSSYSILKQIRFIARSRNLNEIGQRLPSKIIGENDQINFVSSFIFMPLQSDLAQFGISRQQADLAVLNFKEVVNSRLNRAEFNLNDNGTQYLLIKNTEVMHGRDEVEEDLTGERLVIGIPLQEKKLPSAIVDPLSKEKVLNTKNLKTS